MKSERHLVLPDYFHQSIALIPNTVHAFFGNSVGPHLSIGKRALGFEHPDHVVLFLLDGFGLDLFHRYAKPVKFLKHFSNHGELQALTSVFPSTTAAALTTLHTNRMPVEHGNFEWHWHYAKANALIESLPFCVKGNDPDSLVADGYSPSDLYDGETLYTELASRDIASHAFVVESIANSVYSTQTMRGALVHGYSNYANLFRQLANVLEKPGPSYSFVYMGQLDSKMHRFGPHSDAFVEELDKLDANFIKFLRQSRPYNTVFLLTADHGHINTDPETTTYLDDIPGLFHLFARQNGQLMFPGGSPRDVFLYIKKNAIAKAKKLLEAHLPDCSILETKQLLKEKWLGHGKIHPQLRSRLGNLVILPVFGHTVWYRHPKKPRFTHRGMHGGLSIREMQVPFLTLGKTGFLQGPPATNPGVFQKTLDYLPDDYANPELEKTPARPLPNSSCLASAQTPDPIPLGNASTTLSPVPSSENPSLEIHAPISREPPAIQAPDTLASKNA